jgi:hypothetical protein
VADGVWIVGDAEAEEAVGVDGVVEVGAVAEVGGVAEAKEAAGKVMTARAVGT